jgi:hypothetical protein|tara:strand:+ start:338 stop:721 length:384 start_codon:yes stop_codon:yes gene_type:complete
MTVIDAKQRFGDMEKALADVDGAPLWMDSVARMAITPAAQDLLEKAHGGPRMAQVYGSFLIMLMAGGDFGAVDRHDSIANMAAIKSNGQVMGVYPADPTNEEQEGNVIWMIVDPGHKVLTVLTPSDY